MTLLSTNIQRRRLLAALGISGVASLAGPSPLTAQRSPFATPASPVGDDVPAATDGPLTQLLTMVPLSVLDNSSSGMPWSFVDVARQYAAHGMHHDINGPDLDNEPFHQPTYALAAMSSTFSFALIEEFTGGIGFNPLGIDQLLYVGDPPNQIHLFRAPFDPAGLEAAWIESGYEPVATSSGVPAWTTGPDGEISLTHPVQQFIFAALNNVAIVDDVLIATTTLERLDLILDAIQAGGDSLLDEPATGHLVATVPETIVSAIALQPRAIGGEPVADDGRVLQETEFVAIRSEVGPMPPVQGTIFAVNEGATMIDSDWSPDGTPVAVPRPHAGEAFMRLGMDTPADAEQALAVIEQRWERLQSSVSPRPFTEIMELASGSTVGNVVELEFLQLLAPNTWFQIIMSRDLFFLAPDEDQP